MKKLAARLALVLGGALVGICAAHASIPNNTHKTTFIGPTAKGAYTSTLSNTSAFSVLGEVGFKNFRLGGTLASLLSSDQRIKVSAELLTQDLSYAFFSGNTNQWTNQGALGAAYQYDLNGYNYNPQFNLSAFVSHAPSKSLSTVTGTYTNPTTGLPTAFTDNRRIAGSTAVGVAPGISVEPWSGGKAGLDINYDNVVYDKNFSPNEDAKGLGATLRLSQALTQDVNFGVSAAVRQPFNNYTANVAWTGWPNWTFGVDGAYTIGKNTLPSSYNASLSASYAIDQRAPVHDYKDMKAEATPISDPLVPWAATPAVYMPEVLAVPDDQVILGCAGGAVAFSGTIPSGTTLPGGLLTIATAGFFTGSGLTFTMTQSKAPAPGNTLTIAAGTGVVTATGTVTDSITVTVTATNACGSATSNSFVITY